MSAEEVNVNGDETVDNGGASTLDSGGGGRKTCKHAPLNAHHTRTSPSSEAL